MVNSSSTSPIQRTASVSFLSDSEPGLNFPDDGQHDLDVLPELRAGEQVNPLTFPAYSEADLRPQDESKIFDSILRLKEWLPDAAGEGRVRNLLTCSKVPEESSRAGHRPEVQPGSDRIKADEAVR